MDEASDNVDFRAQRTRRLFPWFLAIFVLVLFAGGAALLLSGGFQYQYFSSPTEPRDDRNYEETIGPAQAPPKVDPGLFDSLEITRTNNSVKIQFSGERPSSRLLDYELERIPAGKTFKWEKGEVRLISQGIGYAPYAEHERDGHSESVLDGLSIKDRYSVSVPGKFFYPDGRLIPTNELSEASSRKLSFDGIYPEVQFVFGHPAEAEIKFIGFHFFDARTHSSLANGYSWGSQGEGRMKVDTELERWHGGPVKVVADVGLGPVETIDIPAREGSVIRTKHWMLHLVVVRDGESHGTSQSSSGDGTTITFRFREEDDDARKETTFVFLGSPWAYHLPVDFEFYDKEGNEIRGGGAGSSSYYRTIRAYAPQEQIHTIRAVIYPDIRRLVFEVPEIYGLPKENYGVKNLFDVHLPYLRIRSKWEFRRVVENLVQMEFKGRVPNFNPPAGYLPKVFTNATPKEVLQEFMRVAVTNQPSRLHVDSENHTLELRGPLWEELLLKLKNLVGL